MLKDLTLNTRAATPSAKPATPNPSTQQGTQSGPIRGTQEKITVLLADDHAVVREGLRLLLESTEDIQVIGEVENGRKAVEMAKSLRPDVVLLDLAMPNLNGLEATRQILKEVPGVKVLILSSFSDDDRVQELIEAGAIGYLAKQTAAHDLVKGIREAKKGNASFSPSILEAAPGKVPANICQRRGRKEERQHPHHPRSRSSATHR